MRRPVTFQASKDPVEGPVTKLGGRPTWLEQPQWPLSRTLGRPMFFLGQFRIDDGPDEEPRLAFLFMTDSVNLEIMDEEDDPEGYEELPEAGDTFLPEGGENAVIVQPAGRVPSFITVQAADEPRMWFHQEDYLPVEHQIGEGHEPAQFLGGEPVWLQSDETPGAGWRLVAQINDALGFNFGDVGIGYVFVSPDGAEGRFLWQCH